ncbi:MAG: DUF1015 domain-containing protein [Clostridia bacterium]|nr:DUF1015 domain-containing protein [Clostridia bacterium]
MFEKFGIRVPEILLPDEKYDLKQWAVIACDQFTSQPEYWDRVRSRVFDRPSTLHITYPEAWLDQGDARIASINETMLDYEKNVLTRAVKGMVLVEREIATGSRIGLMAAVDLEKYDFSVGSQSLIRATEGTVLERIPPRVKIRENAALETPHILVLVDDPKRTLINPLYAARDTFEKLYDFDLMLGGGHIRGWLVNRFDTVLPALEGLLEASDGLLFAVGDGNHSLATARQCWLNLKPTLTAEQRETHPARFALVELTNVHDDALQFEPIHRVVFGVDPAELSYDLGVWLGNQGMKLTVCTADRAMFRWAQGYRTLPYTIDRLNEPLPLAVLQRFLDEWLAKHENASIDYIHGEEATRELSSRPNTTGILLPAMDKFILFEAVRKGGALPRKSFSMGEAEEKRYYLECRKITGAPV